MYNICMLQPLHKKKKLCDCSKEEKYQERWTPREKQKKKCMQGKYIEYNEPEAKYAEAL